MVIQGKVYLETLRYYCYVFNTIFIFKLKHVLCVNFHTSLVSNIEVKEKKKKKKKTVYKFTLDIPNSLNCRENNFE